MNIWKLALYIICIATLLFVFAVGEALAQGPVYNPPTYNNSSWSLGYELNYGYARGVYDLNYAVQYSQHGYGQVNTYWQNYQQGGVWGQGGGW